MEYVQGLQNLILGQASENGPHENGNGHNNALTEESSEKPHSCRLAVLQRL